MSLASFTLDIQMVAWAQIEYVTDAGSGVGLHMNDDVSKFERTYLNIESCGITRSVCV